MTEYVDFRKLKYDRDFFTWYHSKATQLEKELADFVFQYSDDYFSDFKFESNTIVTDFIEAKTSDDGGVSYYNVFLTHPKNFNASSNLFWKYINIKSRLLKKERSAK